MNNDKIEKILVRIFIALAGIVFISLSLVSFFISYVNQELVDEHVFLKHDNILFNVLGIVVIVALLTLGRGFWKKKKDKINVRILASVLSIISMVFSIYWVLTTGTEVQADQWKICKAAVELNQGNYECLQQGNYLANCPHQLGITTILRVIFALFGEWNVLPFQILSAVGVGVIVFFTYKIAEELTNSKAVELLSLLAIFACIPVYFYTPFVYGELLSMAISQVTLYLFLKLQREFKLGYFVGIVITTATMILVRKNTIILVVAMVGVTVVRALLERQKKYLIIVLTLAAGVLVKSASLGVMYDSHIPEGVDEIPSILYVVMGTNDDWGYAGWSNGIHAGIYEDSNYDVDAASQAGVEILKNFAEICAHNPKYAVDFYFRKISSQWAAPMYQSLVMNNNITGEQSTFAHYIYYDATAWKLMDGYMNIYQLMLYLSLVCMLIYLWEHPGKLAFYTGLIGVYGGFLFSILWETKTRYVFPYLIIMIPYAAFGAVIMVKWIADFRKKKAE